MFMSYIMDDVVACSSKTKLSFLCVAMETKPLLVMIIITEFSKTGPNHV